MFSLPYRYDDDALACQIKNQWLYGIAAQLLFQHAEAAYATRRNS